MSAAPPFRFAAVILGAGASSRMGRPKLLLRWGETTVIGHLLAVWQSLGATQVGVVIPCADSQLSQELSRVDAGVAQISNARTDLGMFESIRCAAQWENWHPQVTHFGVVLGDQPHLRTATLREILRLAAQHPESICQPSRNGRGRHPVVLPRRVFRALADSKAEHLKDFLRQCPDPPRRIELADSGLDIDMDTPEDYERALALFKHEHVA